MKRCLKPIAVKEFVNYKDLYLCDHGNGTKYIINMKTKRLLYSSSRESDIGKEIETTCQNCKPMTKPDFVKYKLLGYI